MFTCVTHCTRTLSSGDLESCAAAARSLHQAAPIANTTLHLATPQHLLGVPAGTAATIKTRHTSCCDNSLSHVAQFYVIILFPCDTRLSTKPTSFILSPVSSSSSTCIKSSHPKNTWMDQGLPRLLFPAQFPVPAK